ncbi:MAG TPA: GNAT family N-acetyltransferase [Ideonella sp.]|nr:GNAT family N-acetyltransferase [Ideonella sp.]
MKQQLLDITWRTLSGPHAAYSAGGEDARRYAPGFTPIVGFADSERPNFETLRPHCKPGEHFYCDGWSGPAPAGWRIDEETTMFKMLWSSAPPAEDAFPEAVSLTRQHAPQALELALLTKPGPFGLRTLELGEYFGCFDGPRLMAMAGERMFAGGLREISAVCTHPDYQGRGLARRLMTLLIRRQMLRGETPFLHVMRANSGAHGLYTRMGFDDVHETVVRVVSPC